MTFLAMREIPIPPPFTCVPDVVEGLAALERTFASTRDQRAVFVTAYLAITRTLHTWLEHGVFAQNAVVAAYAVAFANAYRQALASHERGDAAAVPAAWRQAFAACGEPRVSTLQCLLLGINAHINHDLPHAVLQGGLDVNCDRCYRDHTRINDALRAATPLVRRRVTSTYQRGLTAASWLYGRAIDEAAGATFARARQNAWTIAKALAAAPSPDRPRLGLLIDARAVRMGAAILRRRAPRGCLAGLCDEPGEL